PVTGVQACALPISGNLLPRRAGLPDTQEPDPVKPQSCQPVQIRVGDVIQRGGVAQVAGAFREPDAGVDLVERRVADGRHGSSLATVSPLPRGGGGGGGGGGVEPRGGRRPPPPPPPPPAGAGE